MVSKFTNQMWEAAGWTFLQMFLITLGPSVAAMQVGDWNGFLGVVVSAAMAGLGAAASLLKSIIVSNLGENSSMFVSGAEDCGPVGEG